ncbi:hypothetical protein PG999_012432 [Apiospora kogelbergensis]|uniref:Uncharacterized protein n=1 Tax=Apiospora kogelbergensis TaxID=1337665 RepID=A0AAW0QNE1_9PEZI
MAEYNQTGRGFLVPEWFVEQPVYPTTMNTASVFLGLSLGGAMFAASKAMQQTTRMWKRHGTITAYAIKKCLFLIIDLGLNIAFIRLVKNRLIANGLTKYDRLLSGNLALVVINISLDVRCPNQYSCARARVRPTWTFG